MKKILIANFIFLWFLLSSCVTLKSCGDIEKEDVDKPTQTVNLPEQIVAIQNVETAVRDGIDGIKSNASEIKNETSVGKKNFPQIPHWDFIGEKAESISKTGDVIGNKLNELNKVNADLTIAEAEKKKQEEYVSSSENKIKKLEEDSKKMSEEIDSYKNGAKRQQQIIWMTVSGFSAIGIVVGIFLFIYAKSELGIALGVSSLILACVSYFMAAYALIVAVIGGLLLLGVIGYLIYYLVMHKKALSETVTSIQAVKTRALSSPDAKEEISIIQSPSTKRLIYELKLQRGLK